MADSAQDRFQKVRELDPQDLATDLLGPVEGHTTGRLYWRCPKHDDNKPSLFLNTAGQWEGRFACFPCGFHGDIVDLFVFVRGMSKREVLDFLVPRTDNVHTPNRQSIAPKEWFDGLAWGDVTSELGLQLVFDKYECPRIRFPFRMNGEVVYWQDRALGNSSIRWLSHEGPCPCPYEVDRILPQIGGGTVYVCEGITDTVSLIATYSDVAVVGIPGSSAKKPEWGRFFEGVDMVIIGDNDEAGMKFRATMMEYGGCNHNLYVPDEFNDLTDWRRDDPDSFGYQFEATVSSLFGTS